MDKPSTCTCDYWIYARNQTTINNTKPVDNCGKWMLFEPWAQIDDVWNTIKKATESGQLGHASKVATRKDKSGEPDHSSTSVICIYTYDWMDEADVMRVRDALRELGFTRKLPYKSDSDTIAGKYRATGHTKISKFYC